MFLSGLEEFDADTGAFWSGTPVPAPPPAVFSRNAAVFLGKLYGFVTSQYVTAAYSSVSLPSSDGEIRSHACSSALPPVSAAFLYGKGAPPAVIGRNQEEDRQI